MTHEHIPPSPLVVAKFGGTSVARPYAIANAINNDRPAVIVVSAVGATEGDNSRLTDLLIQHEQEPSRHLLQRMIAKLAVVSSHHVRANLHELILDVQDDIAEYRSNNWPLAALGEKWTVERLRGAERLMPQGLVQFDSDGELLVEESSAAIAERVSTNRIFLVPGYYGYDPDGNLRTLARGGSDITGALFARALNADEYHNWSDVDGFYDADPRTNSSAQLIEQLNYRDVVRFAGNTGCQLLHPAAAELLDGTNTITVMRNTMRGGYRGTVISTHPLEQVA